MGIREYFKQHPEEEELKIQHIKIEDKEKRSVEFEFDPSEIITDEFFNKLKTWIETIDLEYEKHLHQATRTFELAAYLKLLFPEKKIETNFDFLFELYEENNHPILLMYIKILFPDRFKSLKFEREEIESNISYFLHPIYYDSLDASLSNGEALRSVFPELLDEILDEEIFRKAKERLDIAYEKNDWKQYIENAGRLGIIFLNKTRKDLRLDEKSFLGVKKILYEKYNWGIEYRLNSVRLTYYLKFLTDMEREVSNFRIKRNQRPERKKF